MHAKINRSDPPQVLPKELRPAAAAAKKRAARVAERLGAVTAALRLLGGHNGGKAPAKLAKALAALDKAKASGLCRFAFVRPPPGRSCQFRISV